MNKDHSQPFDDHELLLRLLQNDEAAFTLLYQKYWPVLVRLALKVLHERDICEEIVQELFITLYRKRSQLKIKISLSSYLYVSLRNRIRNYIRFQSIYNKHIRIAKRADAAATSNDVEQFVDRSDLQREISICLNGMPMKCREVYLLYHQVQCPLKKIALLLDRPVDTVEKQFRKAILLLRDHLTGCRIEA